MQGPKVQEWYLQLYYIQERTGTHLQSLNVTNAIDTVSIAQIKFHFPLQGSIHQENHRTQKSRYEAPPGVKPNYNN